MALSPKQYLQKFSRFYCIAGITEEFFWYPIQNDTVSELENNFAHLPQIMRIGFASRSICPIFLPHVLQQTSFVLQRSIIDYLHDTIYAAHLKEII